MDPTLLNPVLVVDLSVSLSEGLPGTWPGHMTFAHDNWNRFAVKWRAQRVAPGA